MDASDTSQPQLVTSMLKNVVVWCGAGDNFTACIALDNNADIKKTSDTKNKTSNTISQRVYTCGANDCGQLGLGGTFMHERLNGGWFICRYTLLTFTLAYLMFIINNHIA